MTFEGCHEGEEWWPDLTPSHAHASPLVDVAGEFPTHFPEHESGNNGAGSPFDGL